MSGGEDCWEGSEGGRTLIMAAGDDKGTLRFSAG